MIGDLKQHIDEATGTSLGDVMDLSPKIKEKPIRGRAMSFDPKAEVRGQDSTGDMEEVDNDTSDALAAYRRRIGLR